MHGSFASAVDFVCLGVCLVVIVVVVVVLVCLDNNENCGDSSGSGVDDVKMRFEIKICRLTKDIRTPIKCSKT